MYNSYPHLLVFNCSILDFLSYLIIARQCNKMDIIIIERSDTMQNTKPGTITLNSKSYDTNIPITCPYCGAFVQPSQKQAVGVAYNDSSSIILVSFMVTCCNKLFFSTFQKYQSKNEADLLYTYPLYQLDNLPESIHEISPRFVELYKQANYAESMNFFELAGTGYRNALEVLIKDYAINELKEDRSDVITKKLYKSIELYLPNIKLSNSADVIRVLGNDNTHYERKYENIDFDILKQYLKIFINAIETEYLIAHPVVPTNR